MKTVALFVITMILTGTSVISSSKKFAGTYCYGSNIEYTPTGCIDIYPETDSTILFYLSVSKGAPSYSIGQLYGRAHVKGNTAYYTPSEIQTCCVAISFSRNSCTVRSLGDFVCQYFGHGVYPDGTFIKTKTAPRNFFTDLAGDTIGFNIDPDKWRSR